MFKQIKVQNGVFIFFFVYSKVTIFIKTAEELHDKYLIKTTIPSNVNMSGFVVKPN